MLDRVKPEAELGRALGLKQAAKLLRKLADHKGRVVGTNEIKEAAESLESIADEISRDARKALDRPKPPDCDYCSPDHRYYGPGWVYMGNNGPVSPCPVCNKSGATPRRK